MPGVAGVAAGARVAAAVVAAAVVVVGSKLGLPTVVEISTLINY